MKKSLTLAGLLCLALAPGRAETKVDFAKDIQPILQKRCIECHGPEKQKGKLRLDSKEATFKGGGDGKVLEPGKADQSDLFKRVALPAGHDDIMPAKGDPLTKEQIELLREWINQGATWPDGLVIKSGEGGSETAAKSNRPEDIQPSAAELKAIADLEKRGILVRPIAMDVHWTEANLRVLGTNVTDETIAPLKDVLSLVDLNLSGTRITDATLANIKGLTNLDHLHLEHTAVTDAGLANLKGLVNLTYLNLYDTSITDAGIEHIQGLSNLQHLYLWQSKVTDAGAEKLKAALPKTEINRGLELAVVKEEKKEDPKEEAKKEDAKKDEKKPEAKKPDDKQAEPKKEDDKKADAQKPADKKAEDKKADDKKPDDKQKN